MELTKCQFRALTLLQKQSNVFLTGEAGTGKSFLIRKYLLKYAPKTILLASTGSAAVLIGGRTFHSFFGLGILEGGRRATVEKAVKNRKLLKRIGECSEIIIDEVSMLSGLVLETAEEIARHARESHLPWGGLRVVTVGDFAQLPPVHRFSGSRDWAFSRPVWKKSLFEEVCLKTPVRFVDQEFHSILSSLRFGCLSPELEKFLNTQITSKLPKDVTHLYPRRKNVQKFNWDRLNEINKPLKRIESVYSGRSDAIEILKKQAPVLEVLDLKQDAYIMMRQNDPLGRWVNGSTGWVKNIDSDQLTIELVSGRTIKTGKTTFSMLDADGHILAEVMNFPIQLAYASTIHKSQGQTFDRAVIFLKKLWESGQAYVALSRLRSMKGLYLADWCPESFRVDPMVLEFYKRFQ